MQEFSFPMDGGLAEGLVQDTQAPPGAVGSQYMGNLRPEPFGASSPEIIYNTVRASQSWPFPKLVRDERVTLLLDSTGVFPITEGSPTWTTGTGLVLKSSFDRTTTITLSGGTHWDFCAFEDGHWFATNGVEFVFKLSTYAQNLVGYFDASTTKLATACLCRHGDTLLVGGLSGGTWFTDTRFQSLFDLWRLKQRGLGYSGQTWDNKWVMWSQNRGGAPDGPFFLMMCALGLFGTSLYDKFEPEIRQAVEDGALGFVSTKDTVAPRQMKALGGSVRVYGPNTITILNKNDGPGYTPDYGTAYGVRGFAVSGDDTEHAWITPAGDLFHTRLGFLNFRWIFQSSPSSTTWATPVMSFDPERGEHYISNGTLTFLLTPNGKLGGPLTFVPTNVFRSDGKLVGVTQYHAGSSSETIVGSGIATGTTWTAEYRSHPVYMNYRGSKRLQVVEVMYENMTSPKCDIYARPGAATAYTSMRGEIPLNSEGTCYPLRSGNDFKVYVKGTVNAGDRYGLTGILVRYQGESRRDRRGTGPSVAES